MLGKPRFLVPTSYFPGRHCQAPPKSAALLCPPPPLQPRSTSREHSQHLPPSGRSPGVLLEHNPLPWSPGSLAKTKDGLARFPETLGAPTQLAEAGRVVQGHAVTLRVSGKQASWARERRCGCWAVKPVPAVSPRTPAVCTGARRKGQVARRWAHTCHWLPAAPHGGPGGQA